MEMDTGRILAMVSSPGFNPNAYEFENYNYLDLVERDCHKTPILPVEPGNDGAISAGCLQNNNYLKRLWRVGVLRKTQNMNAAMFLMSWLVFHGMTGLTNIF